MRSGVGCAMAKTAGESRKQQFKLSVPLATAQYDAIRRAARKAAIPPATWARMVILRETDWNPDSDDEIGD